VPGCLKRWPKRWPLLRAAVAERSMLPALRPGDWLLARRTSRVRPGQLVLAWHPQRPGFLLVKRVAWRAEGGWWLASDNPAAGAVDSSRFGPVPQEKIEAVVLLRYWPLGFRSRGRRRDLHRTGAGNCVGPASSERVRGRRLGYSVKSR
jgi:nickel-type superoxide dismutase maturation protease